MKKLLTGTAAILATLLLALSAGCGGATVEMAVERPTAAGAVAGTAVLTADGTVYTYGKDAPLGSMYRTVLGQGEGVTYCAEPTAILTDVIKASYNMALKGNGELWV